jgi:hypothetical protein
MPEDFSKNMVTVTMSGKKDAVIATIKSFFGDSVLESTVQDEILGRPDTFVGIFTLYMSDEEIKTELDEDEVI